ncbi:MAG: RIP metalloprotease RseP [Candidatus Marinimicrobia bacterium]|nr:RIP metalloprotease RseP [Candidatus Neomarinimicrobiota bacterium]
MLTTILATAVVLGILIIVHELGHFFAAKISKVRVEVFSLGFWPRMAGKKIGDTDYRISWIPLGGYVKLAGMIDESMDGDTIKGEPWEFMSKTPMQKIFIITAGVIMNIILAAFIFSVLTFSMGIGEVGETTLISEVVTDYPASEAGVIAGDIVVSLDGNPINSWTEMTEYIHSRPDTELEVGWERNGEFFSEKIQTRAEKVPVDGKIEVLGMIGIKPVVTMRDAGFFESIQSGIGRTYFWIRLTLTSLKMLVTGEESFKSVGGPIFIAQLAGDSARSGMDSLFNLIAILSINLAILNILPIPAFDGGHLIVIIIEWIKKGPLAVKTKMMIQQVGFAIFLVLAAFVIFNDLSR